MNCDVIKLPIFLLSLYFTDLLGGAAADLLRGLSSCVLRLNMTVSFKHADTSLRATDFQKRRHKTR
ncbi:MAG: hypothetical protein ACXVJJ_08565 [Halobacteriota archaeon]